MNNKKGKNSQRNARETAWDCFKATGNVSYYLLYKRLENDKD